MIVSEHWLRDWISTDLSATQIAERLTHAGLEVDGVANLPGKVENLVIGQVKSVAKHPDADRLNLTQVDVGDQVLEIVCGAANVREGMLVAVAMIGAKLPNGLKIKKAKVRGVESMGMLCSASELGLEDDSSGILDLDEDATLGGRVDEYLGLDDALIDIDLTPNRGDCLSVRGIARELRVLVDGDYHPLEVGEQLSTLSDTIEIEIAESSRCPKYLARVVKGVDVGASTPLWMRERLRRSGLRPISPVVDITNYVMLEMGQPMHAFDLGKLNDKIVVRRAKAGETINLLDGSEATLDDDTLVIADAKAPVAIAGVMGGQDSAIDDSSTNIVFESAHFTRKSAAGTARKYGLHTDSSHRFERGVDPQLPREAIERATELLVEICGGEAGPVCDSSTHDKIANKVVEVRFERLKQLLGMPLEKAEVTGILKRVSEQVEEIESGWRVTAPSYRFDVEYEADLVEEVARVKGYDNIPTTIPKIAPRSKVASESSVSLRKLRQSLVARDFFESISYSFVDPSDLMPFGDEEPVKVSNPLADNLSVMRTSLLPGLIKTAQFNLNRQHDRIRIFELGATYHKADDGFTEVQRIAGLVTGPLQPVQWGLDNARSVDFFDLKGDFEALLDLTGSRQGFAFQRAEFDGLHPGQSANVIGIDNGSVIGRIARLHPAVEKQYDLSAGTFVFELDVKSAFSARLPEFKGISKFPESKRDLSVVVDKTVVVAELMTAVRKAVGKQLVDLTLFDVYQGQGVGEGKQSLSIKLTLRERERTLTDEESQQCVAKALNVLETRFGAALR